MRNPFGAQCRKESALGRGWSHDDTGSDGLRNGSICFDINGPWEFIQQDYNGVILPEFTPEAAAAALAGIYRTPGRREAMSKRCMDITASAHTMEARWPDVRRFLDLPE